MSARVTITDMDQVEKYLDRIAFALESIASVLTFLARQSEKKVEE